MQSVTDKGQAIVSEVQLISGAGLATILHPPDPTQAVTIPGYQQVNTPIVTGTQFFVNYANQTIAFNAAQAGNSVAVSYVSLGEELNAVLLNPIISGSAGLIYVGTALGGITGTGADATYHLTTTDIIVAILHVHMYDEVTAAYIANGGVCAYSSELGSMGALYSYEVAAYSPGVSGRIDIFSHGATLPSGHAMSFHVGYLKKP